MPLHAQDGRPAGGLDGQREPAGVPSHHAQVSSHVLDALVMVGGHLGGAAQGHGEVAVDVDLRLHASGDRKSTRLNSSHVASSYAVFCLKKKQYTPAY